MRVLIPILLCSIAFAFAEDSESNAEAEIFKLFSSVDKRIRPRPSNGSSGPVEITVSIHMISFEVDFKRMEVRSQLYLRQTWKDPRLAYERLKLDAAPSEITGVETNKIWVPDTYFENAKVGLEGRNPSNMMCTVQPDGTVLYVQTVSTVFDCPLNVAGSLKNNHSCRITIGSYSNMAKNIEYKWAKHSPVTAVPLVNAQMKQFTYDVNTIVTSTGKYVILTAAFEFVQRCGIFALRMYIPAMVLLLVSWTAFWMNRKNLTARVVIGLGALLALMLQAAYIAQERPEVSYVTPTDMWMGVCIFFAFAALIETVVVSIIGEAKPGNTQSGESENLIQGENGAQPKKSLIEQMKSADCGKKIDYASRIGFPILFIIYALIHFVF